MIAIADFQYELPPHRIAQYPLPERDASKLLVWKDQAIDHRTFRELPDLLPDEAVLFFNNTQVIPARVHFRKASGGLVEVFLLQPLQPALVETAMHSHEPVVYECTIGHLKRWAEGTTLCTPLSTETGAVCTLSATLVNKAQMHVRFAWDNPAWSFAEVVQRAGQVPIPPYLQRPADATDQLRYQTVYSEKEGAVAAPTAGLHFTPALLERLQAKGIGLAYLTLHVSAGTFRPVKTADALAHEMHREQVVVPKQAIEQLVAARTVIAVGTTSLRTLESLYWFAVALQTDPDAPFHIKQYTPYERPVGDSLPTRTEAMQRIVAYMNQHGLEVLQGDTQIYVIPGYRFRVVDGLITNFHQPGSTLMLLVAAFTNGHSWKQIYQAALANDYRFLSYGDSSLLWRINAAAAS